MLKGNRAALRAAFVAFILCVAVFVCILVWEAQVKNLKPFVREPAVGVGALTSVLAPSGWDEPKGMFEREFSSSDRFNILLLGNTEGNLTDAMMVLSIDPPTRSVALISVPRDTFYDVPIMPPPGKKIHANYLIGGPEQAEVAVHETLLGLPIHAYIVIDYAGVGAIVDAVGGVPMYIPQDMDQDEDNQGYHIHLKAGDQVLDGADAVSFLRFRQDYADADMGRQREQREFMLALFERVSSPLRMLSAMRAASGHIDSDLTLSEALSLAKALRGLNLDVVSMMSIPGEMKHLDEENVFFYYPDVAGIETLLRGVYEGGI